MEPSNFLKAAPDHGAQTPLTEEEMEELRNCLRLSQLRRDARRLKETGKTGNYFFHGTEEFYSDDDTIDFWE